MRIAIFLAFYAMKSTCIVGVFNVSYRYFSFSVIQISDWATRGFTATAATYLLLRIGPGPF